MKLDKDQKGNTSKLAENQVIRFRQGEVISGDELKVESRQSAVEVNPPQSTASTYSSQEGILPTGKLAHSQTENSNSEKTLTSDNSRLTTPPVQSQSTTPKSPRKRRGCGCLGNLFWFLFNFIGCVLLIFALIILSFMIWFNF